MLLRQNVRYRTRFRLRRKVSRSQKRTAINTTHGAQCRRCSPDAAHRGGLDREGDGPERAVAALGGVGFRRLMPTPPRVSFVSGGVSVCDLLGRPQCTIRCRSETSKTATALAMTFTKSAPCVPRSPETMLWKVTAAATREYTQLLPRATWVRLEHDPLPRRGEKPPRCKVAALMNAFGD